MSDDLLATLQGMIRPESEIEREYWQRLGEMATASDEEIVQLAIRHETARSLRISMDTYDSVSPNLPRAVVAALRACGRLLPQWEKDLLDGRAADDDVEH